MTHSLICGFYGSVQSYNLRIIIYYLPTLRKCDMLFSRLYIFYDIVICPLLTHLYITLYFVYHEINIMFCLPLFGLLLIIYPIFFLCFLSWYQRHIWMQTVGNFGAASFILSKINWKYMRYCIWTTHRTLSDIEEKLRS